MPINAQTVPDQRAAAAWRQRIAQDTAHGGLISAIDGLQAASYLR